MSWRQPFRILGRQGRQRAQLTGGIQGADVGNGAEDRRPGFRKCGNPPQGLDEWHFGQVEVDQLVGVDSPVDRDGHAQSLGKAPQGLSQRRIEGRIGNRPQARDAVGRQVIDALAILDR